MEDTAGRTPNGRRATRCPGCERITVDPKTGSKQWTQCDMPQCGEWERHGLQVYRCRVCGRRFCPACSGRGRSSPAYDSRRRRDSLPPPPSSLFPAMPLRTPAPPSADARGEPQSPLVVVLPLFAGSLSPAQSVTRTPGRERRKPASRLHHMPSFRS